MFSKRCLWRIHWNKKSIWIINFIEDLENTKFNFTDSHEKILSMNFGNDSVDLKLLIENKLKYFDFLKIKHSVNDNLLPEIYHYLKNCPGTSITV